MMPSEPAMLSPPTITGRPAATAPPNTRNSTTVTNGSAEDSMCFWSLAMVPVKRVGHRLDPGELHRTAVELLQSRRDVLVVVEDVSSSSPFSGMETKVYFLSWVTMP